MKRHILLLTLMMVIIVFQACDQTRKLTKTAENEETTTMADNSRTSLDWDGDYTGTLPCADCPGIQTMIKLNQDLSYAMQSKYMDKGDEVFSSRGSFTWDDQGGKISLKTGEKQTDPSLFLVGENQLIMLDRNGDRITGDLADKYVLKKLVEGIESRYWKLTEIGGQAVPEDGPFKTQPHLMLDLENQRATGSGGCNSFTGGYEIKEGMRIAFSQMASTRMACPDMSIENQLLEVLEKVDNYTLNDDQLTLTKGRMTPLARFEAVYLR